MPVFRAGVDDVMLNIGEVPGFSPAIPKTIMQKTQPQFSTQQNQPRIKVVQ